MDAHWRSLWEGPHTGAEDRPLSLCSGRNNLRWTGCNPYFLSLYTGKKWSLEKRKGCGEGVFKILSYSFSCSDFFSNQVRSWSSVCSAGNSIWWETSPYLNLWRLCSIFSLLSTGRREWECGFGGCLASSQHPTTTLFLQNLTEPFWFLQQPEELGQVYVCAEFSTSTQALIYLITLAYELQQSDH